MNTVLPFRSPAVCSAATLRLYALPRQEGGAIFWRINGFRAQLMVWTEDEWQKLEARPSDAQKHPSGVWCALRME